MGTTRDDHPLRHAPFRWLVTGTTINLLGSGIAPVALAFAVLDLGGGASELGLVVGLYALADVGRGALRRRSRRPAPPHRHAPGLGRRGRSGAGARGAVADRWLVEHPAAGGPGHGQRLPGRPGQSELVGDHPADRPGRASPAGDLVAPDRPERLDDPRQRRRRPAGGAGSAAAGRSPSTRSRSPSPPRCSRRCGWPRWPLRARRRACGATWRAGFREVMRHTWLWLLILQALLYHLFYGGAQSVLGPIVVGDGLGRPAWGWALVDDDARLRGRRAGHAALAAPARPLRRHLLPGPHRGLPAGHGVVGLAARRTAGCLAARLRPRDLQRRLGPVDPGAGRP